MKIRSFPSPPRGSVTPKPGAVEPVIPQSNLVDWDGGLIRRRKKESSTSKRRQETFLRTLAIGLIALMGMLGIVYVGLTKDRVVSEAVWRDPAAGDYLPKKQTVIPLAEDQALDLVRRVLAARSPEQLSGIARLKDITASEAVEFLTRLDQKDGKIARLDWIGNMDCNDIQIEGVEISFEKESVRPRRALLTPDEQGFWQLDVAALAAACSEPWDKVIREPKIQADLRVVLAPDNYYNGNFSNEREWAAYGLANPDSDIFIIGYCQRGGETQRLLQAVLKDSRAVRAIVRVRKNDLASSRQCEIISVLAEDWILTDSPLEDRHADDDPASGINP